MNHSEINELSRLARLSGEVLRRGEEILGSDIADAENKRTIYRFDGRLLAMSDFASGDYRGCAPHGGKYHWIFPNLDGVGSVRATEQH